MKADRQQLLLIDKSYTIGGFSGWSQIFRGVRCHPQREKRVDPSHPRVLQRVEEVTSYNGQRRHPCSCLGPRQLDDNVLGLQGNTVQPHQQAGRGRNYMMMDHLLYMTVA